MLQTDQVSNRQFLLITLRLAGLFCVKIPFSKSPKRRSWGVWPRLQSSLVSASSAWLMENSPGLQWQGTPKFAQQRAERRQEQEVGIFQASFLLQVGTALQPLSSCVNPLVQECLYNYRELATKILGKPRYLPFYSQWRLWAYQVPCVCCSVFSSTTSLF